MITRVSGNGPPTQLLEQFCEITVIVDSVRTKSIRMCILSFLPTLRCLEGAPIKYVRNLLKEQKLQKLSPEELQFRNFDELSRGERIRRLERSWLEVCLVLC